MLKLIIKKKQNKIRCMHPYIHSSTIYNRQDIENKVIVTKGERGEGNKLGLWD